MVNGVTQHPIEGMSLTYTFDDAKAADHRKTQYFEHLGNSGLYHDGWFASTTPVRLPWIGVGTDMDVLTTKWELYNIDKDFSRPMTWPTRCPRSSARCRCVSMPKRPSSMSCRSSLRG